MLTNKIDEHVNTWAEPINAQFDSYGRPPLPEKFEKDKKGVCKTCGGKQVIAYASSCLTKAMPCPHCMPNAPQTTQYVGHHQIVHFTTGEKKTIEHVKKYWENEWTHIVDKTGKEWIINKANVLCVEVIP